jgi:hypothetical protein
LERRLAAGLQRDSCGKAECNSALRFLREVEESAGEERGVGWIKRPLSLTLSRLGEARGKRP